MSDRTRLRRGGLLLLGIAAAVAHAVAFATSTASAAEPTVLSTPLQDAGALTAGPDGDMWILDRSMGYESSSSAPGRHAARIAMDGTVDVVPVPAGVGFPHETGLVALADGSVGFVARLAADRTRRDFRLVRMRAGTAVSSRLLPSVVDGATTVALLPDGTVWFARSCGDRLGRLDPTGAVRRFRLRRLGCSAVDDHVDPWRSAVIRQGPDGMVWLVDRCQGRIARVDLGGTLREWRISSACVDDPRTALAMPSAVAFGENGELQTPGLRVTPAGLLRRDRDLWVPDAITADGSRWFGQTWSRTLAQQTPAGAERTVGTDGDGPLIATAAGPDRRLWQLRAPVEYRSPDFFKLSRPVLAAAGTAGEIDERIEFAALWQGDSATTMPLLAAGPDGAMWSALSSWGSATTIVRVPTGAGPATPRIAVTRLLRRVGAGAWLQLACSAPPGRYCTGRVDLRDRRGRTLARHAPYAVPGGTRQAVRIVLTPGAMRALRHGTVRATARAVGATNDTTAVEVPR